MTGAVGFLGRYVLRDLLLAEVPVAVLVRDSKSESAQQRVETVMSHWDNEVGRALPRPVQGTPVGSANRPPARGRFYCCRSGSQPFLNRRGDGFDDGEGKWAFADG